MNVSEFRSHMSVVNELLAGWQDVSGSGLHCIGWVILLRRAAIILSRVADELERDMKSEGK